MTDPKILINLREIRSRSGLSLSQAAERTGVSKAMLGQIERGESSPTIATLWKLAKGFHLPLSAFLRTEPACSATVAPVRFAGSIAVETLFPFDPLLRSETYRITLEPGQEHVSLGHEAGVIEDVVVTAGEIEILREGTWHRCAPGEGQRFAADGDHGYRNPHPQVAQFLNIMHYPGRS